MHMAIKLVDLIKELRDLRQMIHQQREINVNVRVTDLQANILFFPIDVFLLYPIFDCLFVLCKTDLRSLFCSHFHVVCFCSSRNKKRAKYDKFPLLLLLLLFTGNHSDH